MKALCLYLPQYHPIPENDAWWGPGFTDWQNVAAATPRYRGHGQPHIPADLGFYDLRLEETRVAQAALAAEHGITGFCYYHYWFNGRILLERPFDEVLRSGRPDFPFCLCWANENWTRRWDGREREVLISQRYGEYDPIQHIEWLERAFGDRRYMTVRNKPLFLIYRPDDIVNLREVIKAWRSYLERRDHPGIYLVAMDTWFSRRTPDENRELGFDAIMDFQPNMRRLGIKARRRYTPLHAARWLINRGSDVLGLDTVPRRPVTLRYDYRAVVGASLARPEPDHIVFPCVMPSWDNSPRKRVAQVIENHDAELYARWLRGAIRRVERYEPDEQIVFINAWNEWAEGCHLEPDVRHGRAFLEATARALRDVC